jgi:uncharacterized membrane protein HdeD (DUF308 family)
MINTIASGSAAIEAQAVSAAVAKNRIWFIALGIILIILGVAAIGAPLATTIAVKIVLGWLFLAAGFAQVVHSFFALDWRGFLGDVLIGLLYVGVGAWLAFFPLTGILGLTVLLAIMFLAEGVFKFMMALQVRPLDGWFWVVLSGLASIAVGGMIFLELPSSAEWAIGLLAGINMLMSGLAFLMMTLFAQSATASGKL